MFGVHRVDLRLQPVHLGLRHAQGRPFRIVLVRRAQVGAQIEQVVLDAREHGVGRPVVVHPVALSVTPREAEDAVAFVDRAVGRHAGVVLRHPRAAAQAGQPLVAAAGVNPVQLDHGAP